MKRLYNRQYQKSRRKELRNAPTEAEEVLWKALSEGKMMGYKFRRQHGIDPYIVDFYCPELRLAIEIDGEHHDTAEENHNDALREREIIAKRITVLRLKNSEILSNNPAALVRIVTTIRQIEATRFPPQSQRKK